MPSVRAGVGALLLVIEFFSPKSLLLEDRGRVLLLVGHELVELGCDDSATLVKCLENIASRPSKLG